MDWARELGWRVPDRAGLARLGALFLSLEQPKGTRLGFYDNPQRPPARPVRAELKGFAQRQMLPRRRMGGVSPAPETLRTIACMVLSARRRSNPPTPAPEFKCEVYWCKKTLAEKPQSTCCFLGFALGHLAPLGIPSGSPMFPPGCGAGGQPPPPASGVAGCSASCPPLAVDEFR